MVLACVLWTGAAQAQTALLAEVEFALEGGVSGTNDGVEALIRLTDSSVGDGPTVFDGIVWTPADIGETMFLTSGSDPDFTEAVARLTNGVTDWIAVQLAVFPGGGGPGFATWEANFFAGQVGLANGIDFGGFEIESIGLRLNSLSIDTSLAGWTDVSVSLTLFVCGPGGSCAPERPPVCVEGPCVFVVNARDDLDDGRCDAAHCSLREAIHAANDLRGVEGGAGGPEDPGPDRIEFAIPGDPPYVIIPDSPLPEILDTIVIDGTMQAEPGVELDGAGLVISARGSLVRGLTFLPLDGPGVHLTPEGSGSRIEGNAFYPRGVGNFIGVLVEGASNSVIGGRLEGQGNLIAGTNPASGDGRPGAGIGVELCPASGVEAMGNRIEGNRIENLYVGVLVFGSDNTIGGIAEGAGNVIADSAFAGVAIQADDFSGTGNEILGNSIFSFMAPGGIGIDLGLDGRTPNDPWDADRGANYLQNFPVLSEATIGEGSLAVSGFLESAPFNAYRLEFFADTVAPLGQVFLGSHTGTTGMDGRLTFELVLPSHVSPYVPVTATATDLETYNTSEFSDWLLAVPLDEVAPSTAIELAGTAGAEGWFRSDVTVTLIATDDPSGTGVALIEFSLDGGSTFETYVGPFLVGGDGVHAVLARAIDHAGNVEPPTASALIRIDSTVPQITIASPEAKAYLHTHMLALGFAASDSLSGLAAGDPSTNLDGASVLDGNVVDLLSLPLGFHTFTVSGSDVAGNATSEAVTFELIATLQSLVGAVNRFVEQGAIVGSKVSRGLLAKLQQAQDSLDRNKPHVARNKLQNFIDQVEGQAGNHVSADAARILVTDAEYVLSTL
jgi:CSLREA domain-containing protein